MEVKEEVKEEGCQGRRMDDEEDWGNWKADGTKDNKVIPQPHFDFQPGAGESSNSWRRPKSPNSYGWKSQGSQWNQGKRKKETKKDKKKKGKKEAKKLPKQQPKKNEKAKNQPPQMLRAAHAEYLRRQMAMNRREKEMDEQLEVFNKRVNQQQELLHSLEKADFSPEDVPRMLHQAVALHSGRHEEVVVEEEGAEMVGRIPGLGIRVSSPLPQVGDLPSDSDDMTLEQLAKLKRTDEDAALLKQKDTVRAMAKHTVHALLLLHLALRIACGRCEKKVAVVPGPVGRGPAGQLALPAAAPVLLNRPLSVAVAAVKAEAKKAKQEAKEAERAEKRESEKFGKEEQQLIEVIYKALQYGPKDFRSLAETQEGSKKCYNVSTVWSDLNKAGKVRGKGGSFSKWLRNLPMIEMGEMSQTPCGALVEYRGPKIPKRAKLTAAPALMALPMPEPPVPHGLRCVPRKQAEVNQEAEVKESPKGKSRSGKGSPAKK